MWQKFQISKRSTKFELRLTERKELFTIHRPHQFFLPHQKVIFWLFEGKFSFFLKIFMNCLWNRINLQSQEALQSSKSPIVIRRHVFSVFYTATVAIVHRFSASLRENGDHHKQMEDFRFFWKASGVGNCGQLIKVNRFWNVRFFDDKRNTLFLRTMFLEARLLYFFQNRGSTVM